jgi:hypothetical protein
MGAKLFHVDGQTIGQTVMVELIDAFRNFPNALRKETLSLLKP